MKRCHLAQVQVSKVQSCTQAQLTCTVLLVSAALVTVLILCEQAPPAPTAVQFLQACKWKCQVSIDPNASPATCLVCDVAATAANALTQVFLQLIAKALDLTLALFVLPLCLLQRNGLPTACCKARKGTDT
jgi:hypothetical protein